MIDSHCHLDFPELAADLTHDAGEAERFDQWLRRPRDHLEGGKGLAENSARKTIGIMKQVFDFRPKIEWEEKI